MSQSKIEVLYTFDQYFADYWKSKNQNPVDVVFEIAEDVRKTYLPTNIDVIPVKVERLDLPYTSSGYELRNMISNAFSQTNRCFTGDLVHHLTGMNVGLGESSGGGLCPIPFTWGGTFSTFKQPGDKGRAAHEIGHCIFGGSHIQESLCNCTNGNFLMCTEIPCSNEPLLFTQEQIAIASSLHITHPCTANNNTANTDCIFCDFGYDYLSDKNTFVLGCNEDNIRMVNSNIRNDCSTIRNVQVDFSFDPLEIEVIDVDPKFAGPFTTTSSSGVIKKYYRHNGQLLRNEQEMYDFKVKVLKGHYNQNNEYIALVEINSSVTPVPQGLSAGFSSHAFIFKGRELEDLTPFPIVDNYKINDVCNCLTPQGSFCKAGKAHKFDFNGTYNVNSNVEYCEGSELSFSSSSELIVKSGKTLKLYGTKLYACGNSLWKGITVEPGGTLIIDNKTIISDALYGINIMQGGSVSVSNSEINDCYVGINLEAGANLSSFFNNTIQTLNGVKSTTLPAPLWSKNTYIGIKAGNTAQGVIGGLVGSNNYGNNFKNLNNGIKSDGADLIIVGNRFENMLLHPNELAPNSTYTYVSGTAIYDVGSVYTYAKLNQINNCRIGIYGQRTGGDFISNEIRNCSTTGILLRDNRSRKIGVSYNNIFAGYTGVELFNINDGSVVNNVISTTASEEGESTTGVISRFGSNNTIADNNVSFLNQKPVHIGVASSNGKGNKITNNTVYANTSLTSKAIALLGGNTNTTNCNLAIDFKDGIYTDNSTGNTLDCNILESESKDININVNSPLQIIMGNQFSYGSNVNLLLTSPIGKQEYHGNSWFDNSLLGADALALSEPEKLQSQFTVDFNKSDTQNKGWYPKKNGAVNSNPIDLFINLPETQGKPTYVCNGCTYGFGGFNTWFNGSPSPEAICNWLNTTTMRLRPAQIKWWQAYIYRLLKKTGRSYASLTPCLKTIWDSVNNTKQKNVETIQDKLNALSSLNLSSTVTAYAQVSNIVSDAVAGQPFDENGYNTAIGSIRTAISNNNAVQTSLFNDINTELSLLSTDQTYNDETLIYTTMLDYLQNNVLPSNNTLKLIAEKCTDDHGENVYFAKDLISLISEVNPLGNNCNDLQNRTSASKQLHYNFAKVYPTLSSGIYNIELMGNEQSRYAILITSLVGEKVKEITTNGGTLRLDLSDKNNGLYIIKIKDLDNLSNEYNTKLIKVE